MFPTRRRAVCAVVRLPATTLRRLRDAAVAAEVAFVPYESPDDPALAVADAILAPLDVIEDGALRGADVLVAQIATTDVETVARALSLGATDVVTPRTHPAEIAARIVAAVGRAATLRALRAAQASAAPVEPVGRSVPFVRLTRALESLAASAAPVLLEGEPGSGRSFAARYLHSVSPRHEHPLLRIDVATLGPDASRHRLFVEAGGALRAARGGTILVSSVERLDPDTQRALARWIRSGEIPAGPARGTAADARMLATCAPAGARRGGPVPELREALAALVISVPPLRDRGADAVLLFRHFLQLPAQSAACDPRESPGGATGDGPQMAATKAPVPRVPAARLAVSDEVRALLLSHAWPGNVAEVRAVAELASLRGQADGIDENRLFSLLAFAAPLRGGAGALADVASLDQTTLGHVLRVLDHAGGNRRRAAKALGIAPRTLYNHLKALPPGESETPR